MDERAGRENGETSEETTVRAYGYGRRAVSYGRRHVATYLAAYDFVRYPKALRWKVPHDPGSVMVQAQDIPLSTRPPTAVCVMTDGRAMLRR